MRVSFGRFGTPGLTTRGLRSSRRTGLWTRCSCCWRALGLRSRLRLWGRSSGGCWALRQAQGPKVWAQGAKRLRWAGWLAVARWALRQAQGPERLRRQGWPTVPKPKKSRAPQAPWPPKAWPLPPSPSASARRRRSATRWRTAASR